MVKNLRAESDRMHALACICRTALCVDLFAKESVRRGQKPLSGTDIASLFEDVRIKEDLNSITSKSLFREELVASLVESCFQLSLPLPEKQNSGTESRVIGALAYGTGYGALNWTEPALEVVEVCRPCVKWDCDGRTYAIDCYLKLLVRLCHIYDTRGGVKTLKDGASPDQILNETRLKSLQIQLIKDLQEVFIIFHMCSSSNVLSLPPPLPWNHFYMYLYDCHVYPYWHSASVNILDNLCIERSDYYFSQHCSISKNYCF